MPHINRNDLYQTITEAHLLPELKNGPTAVMLFHNGEQCLVSLEYSQGNIIAKGDSFTYIYKYPDNLKGEGG